MSTQPHIIFLFRMHSGRKELAKRAIESLHSQSYMSWGILASYETEQDKIDLESLGVQAMRKVNPDKSIGECFFNDYLNILKSSVGDNYWIAILDSDNWVIDGALERVAKELTNPDEVLITQFIRKRVKPSDEMMDNKIVMSGKIDSACIVFHSKHKDVSKFLPTDNGDYAFISDMVSKLPSKFVKIPFIQSDRRSRGL